MGHSFRRNSLQMQKPDLCFILGTSNELLREKSRGPAVHLSRLPLPNLEEASEVSRLSSHKTDYGTVIFILWDFSFCAFCDSL